ncbi:MAG TPA: CmpA/NrtA family ABC transporter substrate-binding protein [Verrucomicrobiae bacterium]|nr:CmpA/NrtA family ABC transporter substrate-binding protein [Verrucomicrobiae bacterium]
MTKKIQIQKSRDRLKLGFVPLTDCAPIVMAHELRLFEKFGVSVSLSRELGWATIRDKVIYGELDAAHAVAGMPFAATLGLGSIQCDCVSALVLNLHGNAITLSNELWNRGVRDGAGLRNEIQNARGKKVFTFGIVHPFSSHNFLLRGWLARVGILPDRDVRIVVVPPPQMVANLKAGHLDGFCVGEPWNSVAVQARAGWTIAASSELDRGHPEKVLMVRREFSEKRNDEHLALIAALLEACEFCDAPENRDQVVATLARREYVGADETALCRGLSGEFDFGHDLARTVPDFTIFSRDDANEPCGRKAAWVIQHLRGSGLCKDAGALNFALGRKVFRTDLFEKAKQFFRDGREDRKGFFEKNKNSFASFAAVA